MQRHENSAVTRSALWLTTTLNISSIHAGKSMQYRGARNKSIMTHVQSHKEKHIMQKHYIVRGMRKEQKEKKILESVNTHAPEFDPVDRQRRSSVTNEDIVSVGWNNRHT